MTSQDQDAPENVTPLLHLASGGAMIGIVYVCGMFAGMPIGENKAWTETEALQDTAQAQLTEANALFRAIAPYLWLLDCNPDPVANIALPDESRAIVSLRCDLGVQVPEDVEAER